MKINGALLALGVFHPNVWGTSAFVVQAPNPRIDALSSMYSFDPGLNDVGTSSGIGIQGQSDARLASSRGQPIRTANDSILVQGGSLKTWSFRSPAVERVMINLETEGRPLNADVELWQGPDNTPHKMRIYVEDGSLRPFRGFMETPRGPNTIAIRNTSQMEFPLAAAVSADNGSIDSLAGDTPPMTIQGGALRTYAFDPSVESVQVLLKTDGRPLNSRIELLQGPNNNKQVIEVYTEDGMDRPFFIIIESPGSGNVVRVVNSSTVEFPLSAWVQPYRIGTYDPNSDVVMGGDSDGGLTLGGI